MPTRERQQYEAANEEEAVQFETLAMERLGRERADAMGKVPITVVDDDEQDDLLASTFLGQERDLVMHRLNLERFETMLNSPGASDRAYIVMLTLQTLDRIDSTTRTIEALTPQLPSQSRLEEAIVRIKAREEAARPDNPTPAP